MARNLMEFNVDDFDASDFKSMYIEASAGTGKTYTIENLVGKLVENGYPLEKILIVTYTEKAVGELKHRIREKLLALNRHADVDNAPIFTIHSFCQKTLEEFSFVARQPYSLNLIDEGELSLFIDKWIRDELKDDASFKDIYMSSSKKADLIDGMKSVFLAAVGKYYLRRDGSEDKSIVALDEIAVVKEATKTLPSYLFTFDECDDLLKSDGSSDDYKKAFSRIGTNANLTNVEKYKVRRFYRKTLSRLYLAWQKEKLSCKQQTFDDMIRNTREAVCKKESGLAKKLREKYTLAIIDEFQDTNQKQWDIFKTIFMKGSAKEKAEHKIIVVGDPKQSIFAFQGADVNVYKTAVQEVSESGGDARCLKTNFRSSTSMIDACNKLFKEKEAADGDEKVKFFVEQEFECSKAPDKEESKIKPATFNGSETAPFWIFGSNDNPAVPVDFAEFAVKKIIECCSYKNKSETNLRVYDKKKSKEEKKPVMRNVSFRDFAVLARTSSEMDVIENVLKEYGVPFYRYKDKNLFQGMECASWISILNAICANDFNGRNRAFLSEALWTKFFGIPLEEISDEKFDNPANEARQKILSWRKIAEKSQWAKLIEAIFEDSKIEESLSNSQNIQSISKFRQIGNYIAEYLYSNDCSLEEAAKHLARLSVSSESSEDDGNLVAKGTNFDSVQIMTIHASKGLEFPVVIASCGFKGSYPRIPAAYLYHAKDAGNEARLSFSDYGKGLMKAEEGYEWRRLFYVAYTRASSLMILPFYEKWVKPGNNGASLEFLGNNFAAFMVDPENKKSFARFSLENGSEKKAELEKDELKKRAVEILKRASDNNSETDSATFDDQLVEVKKVAMKIPQLGLKKHSYSSLARANASEVDVEENSERLDKEQNSSAEISLLDFDNNAKAVLRDDNAFGIFTPPSTIAASYPKGSFLGSAVHEAFEKIDFLKAAKMDLNEFCADDFARSLIDRCFSRHGMEIDQEDSLKWREQTANFIWNTLNARLPEICGGAQTGGDFSLSQISWDCRSSEARFDMVSQFTNGKSKALENFCDGAIDLIFKRQVDGKEIYSLVDWKSNSLDFAQEMDGDLFKNITDEKYAIQRVMYSYCLILWLKEFYGGDEESVFNERFGGIYYVYVRYCQKDTSKGIYAQTWNSWSDLKEAFKNICERLITQGK